MRGDEKGSHRSLYLWVFNLVSLLVFWFVAGEYF